MKTKLITAMEEAVHKLDSYPSKKISLFHHNDTDGLSSGTILLSAFKIAEYEISRFSLEKPYPQVLEKIFFESGQIIIFTDFAGKIAPLISQLNRGRNLVMIIDHHPAEESGDESVINLDGELFGLKGDRDISASATCFLFSEVLLKSVGKNADFLSHLGALGAIGDGFLVNGALSGVNREVMEIAEKGNLIRVVKNTQGEEYFINLGGIEYSATDICVSLDTLGGVGYYQNGTALGIELCQKGLTTTLKKLIEELDLKKEEIFLKEIDNLKQKINTTKNLHWFNVHERFKPMGVKMIGVFCNLIKNMDFLDKTKYLAGFQTVPNEVPGFGEIDFNSTKISMRVSDFLTDEIRNGAAPGLSIFLPAATYKLGGFADACHGLSAATTVKVGQEEDLIIEIEKQLEQLGRN
ncbi:MAG: DHH family phosphoesterase [Spirochaetales bacterium]|nr:DHH family phosphoesterase [Spirochaetales bacterium]